MAKSNQNSHRNWKAVLVEPFKQLKLGIYVLGITALFVFILGFLFLKAFWQQYQHIMEIFAVARFEDQLHLVTNDVFYRNALMIGMFLIAFMIVMLAVVFRITHRYYGPLVSIQRFVEGVSQGDYTRRVILRKSDELQDLALCLNKMADELERRHGSTQSAGAGDEKKAKSSSSEDLVS
ncbi:MAG: hypothetical protein ACOH5I_01320 [Oligoflexus sp.]